MWDFTKWIKYSHFWSSYRKQRLQGSDTVQDLGVLKRSPNRLQGVLPRSGISTFTRLELVRHPKDSRNQEWRVGPDRGRLQRFGFRTTRTRNDENTSGRYQKDPPSFVRRESKWGSTRWKSVLSNKVRGSYYRDKIHCISRWEEERTVRPCRSYRYVTRTLVGMGK